MHLQSISDISITTSCGFFLFLNLAGTSDCKVIVHKIWLVPPKPLALSKKEFFLELMQCFSERAYASSTIKSSSTLAFSECKGPQGPFDPFRPILFRFLDYLSGPLGADFGKTMQHAG